MLIRNLFEQFQTKVELLAKENNDTLTLSDPENLEIYLKTAEILLKTATNNRNELSNLILALEIKRVEQQQKQHQELLAILQSVNKENSTEIVHTKPKEIKNQNMTLEFAKQINELNRINKELRDKLYKITEENKEFKKTLVEKNQELESERKLIDTLGLQALDQRKLIDTLELQITDQQKLIHDLQPKDIEEKEDLQIEKKQIEQVLNKHKNEKHLIIHPWSSFVKTVKKVEKTLNQNKNDEFITKSAIEKSMISPRKSSFFANPPVDRSKISDTDKLICDLSDSFSRKSPT